MNITIINDCKDDNAAGRQIARASALFKAPVSLVGVSSDLEAAGNLIDILDAYDNNPGVILANVAPRNGQAKKWPNGTPFGYFRYRNVLIASSVDGLTLSLAKKLKLADGIEVLDIPTVVARFVKEGIVSEEVGRHIVDTQFRSFDFLPRAAAYLLKNGTLDSERLPAEEIADAPQAIWWIDNFGNCKTSILESELGEGGAIETKFGRIERFRRLKDVPDGTPALIAGSSGLGAHRFLELAVQGESAARVLGISSGDLVV
ncbi:MAG TPA: SAM hydroxide adenosyltransferase [Candidatus Paceibacterota bacterium]|nr:SAM hydroxide adenosyltransferase [Candidatus Paceibacterota bacterium]